MRTVIITGSSGLIGRHLVMRFKNKQYDVREFSSSLKGTHSFSLGDNPPENWFKNCETLIHLAYDFNCSHNEHIEKIINIDGSIKLFNQAISTGVKKIIFISTMSAYDGCASIYGRSKLAVERYVLKHGGCVIRPGLITNNEGLGIYGKLEKIARLSFILPMVGIGKFKQALVSVHELTNAIFGIATMPEFPKRRVLSIADPCTIEFRSLVNDLVRNHWNINAIFIPIPYRFVYYCLSLIESKNIKLSFRSDSLKGLVHYNRNPDIIAPSKFF